MEIEIKFYIASIFGTFNTGQQNLPYYQYNLMDICNAQFCDHMLQSCSNHTDQSNYSPRYLEDKGLHKHLPEKECFIHVIILNFHTVSLTMHLNVHFRYQKS